MSPTTESATTAPTFLSLAADDGTDRPFSFVATASSDYVGTDGGALVEAGSELAAACRGALASSTVGMSSVEVLSSESSGAVGVASLPVTALTVVAGFTPTVASITEQNSLEIIESLSDNVAETSTAKPTTSTVPDVVYDEHGQTWDVYGAEFDPDILGQAIQSYLEKIMARKAQSKPTNGQPLQSEKMTVEEAGLKDCLLYTSPSPRDS